MPSGIEIVIVVVLVAIPAAWFVIRAALPDPPPDACRSCGFLLTGSPGPNCPECGSSAGRIGPAGRLARRRLGMRLVWLFAGMVLMSAVVSMFGQHFPEFDSVEYSGEIQPQAIEFRGWATEWSVPSRRSGARWTPPEPTVVEFEHDERIVRLRRRSRTDDTLVFADDAVAATGEAVVDRLDPEAEWPPEERAEIVWAIDLVLTQAWSEHQINDSFDIFELRPGHAIPLLTRTSGDTIVSTLPLAAIALLVGTLLLAVRLVMTARRALRGELPPARRQQSALGRR